MKNVKNSACFSSLKNQEGGIYIHIPFCVNKCLYCDFYSGGVRIAEWPLFVDSLIQELNSRLNEINFCPSTIYIGGGTPSLIPSEFFTSLLTKINESLFYPEWKEFTLEVNPEDVSKEKIETWKQNGVNRISMGIQSLNNEELRKIGRKHGREGALIALDQLKRNFSNVSVDIMYGLPGQTVESYYESITQILDFEPQHLSAYSLMLEEGTAISLLASKNKIILPNEDEWFEMYNLTNTLLKSKGFRRYEISNYSKPGFESRHNNLYWNGNPYLGLGPAAHSFDGMRERRANPNDIKGYCQRFSNNFQKEQFPFFVSEVLSDNELKEEFIMTRLRMAEGLELDNFEKRFGNVEKNKLLHQSQSYLKENLMEEKNGFLYLNDNGFRLYNTIITKLWDI